MKKSIFAALALLALTGCATRLPEEELRLTRERLDKYLFNEENLTQSEMTILSEYQPGYENIEKQFMADCELWNKKLEEEARKPSAYAGGSMEPMDRNLRMTDLVRKRIDELKTKWQAKP